MVCSAAYMLMTCEEPVACVRVFESCCWQSESRSSNGLARCVRGERSLGNEPAAERGIAFKDRARCEARAARGRGKRESRSHTWTAGIQPPVWRLLLCVCSSYATRDRLCSITAPRRAPCRSPRANKARSRWAQKSAESIILICTRGCGENRARSLGGGAV